MVTASWWATDALARDDTTVSYTTVSALARHLRVDWHTLWRAVKAEATRRTNGKVGGRVTTLGVDEHLAAQPTAVNRSGGDSDGGPDRLRILLVADGTRPYRHRPNHA